MASRSGEMTFLPPTGCDPICTIRRAAPRGRRSPRLCGSFWLRPMSEGREEALGRILNPVLVIGGKEVKQQAADRPDHHRGRARSRHRSRTIYSDGSQPARD